MAALFAATYPARTQALVLYGTYAKRVRTDDYPWAPTLEERLEYAASTESEWGIASDMRTHVPERRRGDGASGGSAGPCRGEPRSGAGAHRDELAHRRSRRCSPTVRVPTLVRAPPRRPARDASRTAASSPSTFPVRGSSSCPASTTCRGSTPTRCSTRSKRSSTRSSCRRARPEVPTAALATTLFTDIVGSTDLNASMGDARWSALLDRHDDIDARGRRAWQGRWVKSTGDGVLAVFDDAGARAAGRAGRAGTPGRPRHAASAPVCTRARSSGGATTSPGSASPIAARLLALARARRGSRDRVRAGPGPGVRHRLRRPRHANVEGRPGTWAAYAVAHGGTDGARGRRRTRAEPSPPRRTCRSPPTRSSAATTTSSGWPPPSRRSRGSSRSRGRAASARRASRSSSRARVEPRGLVRRPEPGDRPARRRRRAFLDTFGVSPREASPTATASSRRSSRARCCSSSTTASTFSTPRPRSCAA